MNNNQIDDILIQWRKQRGTGMIWNGDVNDKVLILEMLKRVYNKTPNAKVLIAVEYFNERVGLIDYLCHRDNIADNKLFDDAIHYNNLKILTNNLIPVGSTYHLCIFNNLPYISDTNYYTLENSTFKFIIGNPNDKHKERMFSICPVINVETQQQAPVKKECIAVPITDQEKLDVLNYYNTYIDGSLNIFGSFDSIQKARVGDPSTNYSAAQYCYQIATNNGWNEHLDMSLDFNKALDKTYNPISIRDRASVTYDIIRLRKELLSDYDDKIKEVINILESNKYEKALIISKRAEFAGKITREVNLAFNKVVCGDYHDNQDPSPINDEFGKPILYKSGAKKGQIKIFCAQFKSSLNAKLFNDDKLSILSLSNAPNRELSLNSVDLVIITSSQCEDFETYKYRLSNVKFNNNVKVIILYVPESIEEKKISGQPYFTGSLTCA